MKSTLIRIAALVTVLMANAGISPAHAQSQPPLNYGTAVSAGQHASGQRLEKKFRVPIVTQQDARIVNSEITLVAGSPEDNTVLLLYTGTIAPQVKMLGSEWLTLVCEAADGTIIGKLRLLRVPADARNRDYQGEVGYLTLLPTFSASDIAKVRPFIVG
jgi:hypothetical protein